MVQSRTAVTVGPHADGRALIESTVRRFEMPHLSPALSAIVIAGATIVAVLAELWLRPAAPFLKIDHAARRIAGAEGRHDPIVTAVGAGVDDPPVLNLAGLEGLRRSEVGEVAPVIGALILRFTAVGPEAEAFLKPLRPAAAGH